MDGIGNKLHGIIGRRVREARNRQNLSQNKLAERLKLSRASIVNIEAGRQHASIQVLWQIAEHLDVEMATFLPLRADLEHETEPIHLTHEDLQMIEGVANGDPRTKRLLTGFIERGRIEASKPNGNQKASN